MSSEQRKFYKRLRVQRAEAIKWESAHELQSSETQMWLRKWGLMALRTKYNGPAPPFGMNTSTCAESLMLSAEQAASLQPPLTFKEREAQRETKWLEDREIVNDASRWDVTVRIERLEVSWDDGDEWTTDHNGLIFYEVAVSCARPFLTTSWTNEDEDEPPPLPRPDPMMQWGAITPGDLELLVWLARGLKTYALWGLD